MVDQQSFVTLYPSKIKTLLVFIASIFFLLIGGYVLSQGDFMGLFFFLPSLISIVISVGNLFFNSSYLRLTKEGYETCTFFVKRFTDWNDVHMFVTLRSLKAGGHVAIIYNNTGKKGRYYYLPFTYGKSAEELAQLLNQWKMQSIQLH